MRAASARSTPEAIERFRVAQQKYKKACSEFSRIQLSWKSIKTPTTAQRVMYLMAKDTFSQECKEYTAERAAWSASFIGDSELIQTQQKRMTLEQILSQMPTAESFDKASKIQNIENDPKFAAILNAARKHIEEGATELPPDSDEVIAGVDADPTMADAFGDLGDE